MSTPSKRSPLTALICSLALTLWLAGPALASSAEDQAALAGAAWLELVDRGDYQQAWRTAGELIRVAITDQAWESLMGQTRQPLGQKLTRQETSRRAYKQLPGAPDGEYLLFTFDASFAHKAHAVETLTLRREADGVWRVVGYFIR